MMTEEGNTDDLDSQFPVGMRVLAVDDNPTCLRLLETMLRKCRYSVTTTSEATVALKLLREKNSKFDLIISDVHNMPDMDGFQLLEYVGLEMDLPVIMLSADDDPSMVWKGINHGACGYLLKPVRLEEVKNIWQHVYRRKRVVLEELKMCRTGHVADPSHEKVGKKQKDENEKHDDNVQQRDEDPSCLRTRKKTRLSWSPELHRKFIAVVNHLGIEKAVPKKILELMDDENLTREHVASHLQKYRLSLKRVSQMANEQARDALLACSSSYAHTGLLSRAGKANLSQFAGHGQLQCRVLRPLSTSPILAKSNTCQLSHTQGSNDPMFSKGADRTTNISIPYRTQDIGMSFGGTYSQSCFTRNQAWSHNSPIHGVCNEVWTSATQPIEDRSNPFPPAESLKQEHSSLPYDFHEDSFAFLLPAGGDLGESQRQAAQIDMILQESLTFIEQPDAEFPSLPSPRDGDFQRLANESDVDPKEEHLPGQEKLQETRFLTSNPANCDSLQDVVSSILKQKVCP